MESILEGLLLLLLILIAGIMAAAVGTFLALNKKLKATFREQPFREKIAYLREQLKSLSGEKDAIREEVVQYINELRERNEITDEDVDGLQKRFDELVREIQDTQAKAKEARDDALRRQEDLDKINHDIREQSGLKETLEKDVERLQKEKDKLEALSEGRSYAEEEERLNAVRDELERVQMDRAAQQTQLDICKDSLKGYKDRLEELKQDLEDHQRQWDDSEEEREKLKELQEDLADAQKELAATRSAAIDSKLTADKLSTDQMRLNNQIDRARQELADAQRALKEPLDELVTRMGEALEAKANALVGLNAQFNSVQSSLEKMKKELRELEARKNAEEGLSREISSEGSKEGAEDPRFESLRTLPDCLHVDKHGSQVLDEAEFINGLRSYLEKSNLSFSSRTLLAYHTALKVQDISPLTVLAGVSGTGKSLLPTKYATFAGFHCLTVPVQPRWDSPQDLLGFYNFLEKKYIATDLSRLLWAYQYSEELFRDDMTVVLLDEMNLARTEYYFSEFLSKLEFRRSNPDLGKIALSSELSQQIGIHENILFVGTMNEDESTQTLSDKVLDRANVLRFGCPDLKERKTVQSGAEGMERYVSRSTWNDWCSRELSPDDRANLDDMILKLNGALNSIGKPFGFRVRDAIRHYVARYPKVDQNLNPMQTALADQIELKILPKLRGLDMNDERTSGALTILGEVINYTDDQDLEQAFDEAKQKSEQLSLFIWNGVTRSIG